MPKTPPSIRPEQIAAFRLRRHHLRNDSPVDDRPADAVAICRDVCGIQAQVMTAAYLQLWTRNHAITRSAVEHALWESRTLLKTSLMRQTIHLIPTDEFPVYIAAQKACRIAGALRVMARFAITREEAESLTPIIMNALSSGPLGRAAIAAAIHSKASKRVRAWMEKCWGHVRIPVAEGMVCYGRGESNDVTFARLDQWLPQMKLTPISPPEAQCILLRKYLRAYGPATLTDFAHWSGLPMREVKSLRDRVEADVMEITADGISALLLREDVDALRNTFAGKASVRLLPHFDVYLLAHRAKNHLLSSRHYKRVYRNQGWISPVVLIGGEIAGVWSHKLQGKKLSVMVESFGTLSQAARKEIECEAEALARFFAVTLHLKFT